MHDLSKTFPSSSGPIQAIQNLNFQVAKGEFISIVGPSGCGKSTLLMCIAGLLRPSTGDVHISGTKVEGPYRDLGFVFQNDLLMPWRRTLGNVTVQGELRRMPKREVKTRAEALLSMVGLDGFEAKYPHELSGGMRQRVAICRALVHNPPLLLMDEPFGALDALTREQLNVDFQRVSDSEGTTVVFVTHNISEAVFLSDRVLVLGPRPANIAAQLRVDLPRPRPYSVHESHAFVELVAGVRSRFVEMGVMRLTS